MPISKNLLATLNLLMALLIYIRNGLIALVPLKYQIIQIYEFLWSKPF